MWPKDVEDAQEIVRDVHEHEILLNFCNDDDALAFRRWLHEVGWGKFLNWKTLQ